MSKRGGGTAHRNWSCPRGGTENDHFYSSLRFGVGVRRGDACSLPKIRDHRSVTSSLVLEPPPAHLLATCPPVPDQKPPSVSTSRPPFVSPQLVLSPQYPPHASRVCHPHRRGEGTAPLPCLWHLRSSTTGLVSQCPQCPQRSPSAPQAQLVLPLDGQHASRVYHSHGRGEGTATRPCPSLPSAQLVLVRNTPLCLWGTAPCPRSLCHPSRPSYLTIRGGWPPW